MNAIHLNDIVRFNDQAISRGAVFCRNHGITGRVIGEEYGSLAIDVGFHYHIYVHLHQIDLVISSKDIPELVE